MNIDLIMTQKEKDLLLKDLCARLPYGVKFQSENIETAFFVDTSDGEVWINGTCIDDFKPYLFPLSSMDKKQTHKFLSTCNGYCEYNWTEETFDWLNAHHFDWRGLIPKELAIDATDKNIY